MVYFIYRIGDWMNSQVNNKTSNKNNNVTTDFKSSVSGNAVLTKEKTRYKYVCFDKMANR